MFRITERTVPLTGRIIRLPSGKKRFLEVNCVVTHEQEHSWKFGYLQVTITQEDPEEIETMLVWGTTPEAGHLWIRYLQIPCMFAACDDYGKGPASAYTMRLIDSAIGALTMHKDKDGKYYLHLPGMVQAMYHDAKGETGRLALTSHSLTHAGDDIELFARELSMITTLAM